MFRSLVLCIALVAASAAWAQPKLIAIANFGEHPALRAAVNGFKAEVQRQGLVEGKDVVFDDQQGRLHPAILGPEPIQPEERDHRGGRWLITRRR